MSKSKKSNKETRFYSSPLSVVKRSEEDESRTIEGYAVNFNKRSKKLGWFEEVIDSRAFDGCDMSDVVAVFNHDESKPLARTSNNSLELSVDDGGLKFRFDIPETSYGNDLLTNIRSGVISECSFAFSVEDQDWDESGDITLRTIKKISRLYDVSPVTRPAYNDTSVALRSFDSQKDDDNKDYMVELGHCERELQLRTKNK